jgi:hypothetical protein
MLAEKYLAHYEDWSPAQVEMHSMELSELRTRGYQMNLTVVLQQEATNQMT